MASHDRALLAVQESRLAKVMLTETSQACTILHNNPKASGKVLMLLNELGFRERQVPESFELEAKVKALGGSVETPQPVLITKQSEAVSPSKQKGMLNQQSKDFFHDVLAKLEANAL